MTTKRVVITPRPKVFLDYYKLCKIPLYVMNLCNIHTFISPVFSTEIPLVGSDSYKATNCFCKCKSLLKFQIRLVYLYKN